MFFEKITQLPVLPQHVQRLMECINDAEVDVLKVVQILHVDPSLTARVLLVANSPLYGLRREVTRVGQAVMILGLDATRNIALSVSLFQMFRPSSDLILKPDEFWKHSLVVACLARLIAKQLKFEDPENAFTAGLLHDFGKIVIMKYFPKEFSLAVTRAKKQEGLLTELENESFGLDHTEVGKVLCKHWNFPASLSKTITQHHEKIKITWPAPVEDQDLTVIKIANNLAKLIPVGDSGNPFFEIQAIQICRLIGLEEKDVKKIFRQLPEELNHLGAFFDLELSAAFAKPDSNSPRVAMVISDLDEKSYLNLLLSAMGIEAVDYSITQFEEIREAAVIVSEDLIPLHLRKIEKEGILLLSWKDWKASSPLVEQGHFHMLSLHKWMREQLLSQQSQKMGVA
ncbi:MAG: HDOD domain-containing protein [Deltaproteobacteria bacterium]|nr:HDOD domain-containing protein [Deltaproteobacteria bacterium]